MKYEIRVKVDTNDADYNETVSTITEEELELIKPLIEAIKNFKPYKVTVDKLDWEHDNNFPYGECCREDLGQIPPEKYYEKCGKDAFDIFLDCCPGCEYGFHTVHLVEIWPVVKKTTLLKV